jgi:hypothetical protein
MVAKFCSSGESEALKGGVHAAACGLALVMAAYNSAAWWYRRERHLGLNTAIYAVTIAWEVLQTRRHWSRCTVACQLVELAAPDRPLEPTDTGESEAA